MNNKSCVLAFALLPVLLGGSPASRTTLDNRLALTPPMGWNSWNHFGCNVSDSLIRQAAGYSTSVSSSFTPSPDPLQPASP